MKGFKVAAARARLGDLLDSAEQGEPVFIERNGVRFRLQIERPSRGPADTRSPFAAIDPHVLEGQWDWSWGPQGVKFRTRQPAR